MSVRREVVDLIIDFDASLWEPPDFRYVRKDGRPFTEAETELIRSATAGELDAARDFFDAMVSAMEQDAAAAEADWGRLREIADVYWAVAGTEQPLGEIMALMTEAERAEITAIIDRLAPTGYVEL